MRSIITTLFAFVAFTFSAKAQQIDSIYFHLYTDSLKKGVYNYINVDGKTHDNRWLPLDAKQIIFEASDGKWDGNNLILDPNFAKDSVTVSAVLKQNTTIKKTIVIYMKRNPENEQLKTEQEIMNDIKTGYKKGRKKG